MPSSSKVPISGAVSVAGLVVVSDKGRTAFDVRVVTFACGRRTHTDAVENATRHDATRHHDATIVTAGAPSCPRGDHQELRRFHGGRAVTVAAGLDAAHAVDVQAVACE